jgi:cytidylate kinase
MTAEGEIRLITVSREFGAGGSELAAELGRRLDWPILDQDIVHRVAERLRLDDKTVERFDEHPPSLLARIATVLVVPQPDIYSFPADGDLPSHDTIAHATRVVIEEMAASPPLIVVGHGAQCIFCNRSDTLHLRLVAPVAVRLKRIMNRMKVDAAFAGTLIHRADRDRQAYVQRYFHRDWRSDQLYTLQINTGHVSIPEAVRLIEAIVRGRGAPVTADAGSAMDSR